MRRYVIAGNWKMNFTPSEATAFINEIKPMVEGKNNCDIIFCAPFVTIASAMEAAKGSNIKIGAQNVHFEEKGAFTGADSKGKIGYFEAADNGIIFLDEVGELPMDMQALSSYIWMQQALFGLWNVYAWERNCLRRCRPVR